MAQRARCVLWVCFFQVALYVTVRQCSVLWIQPESSGGCRGSCASILKAVILDGKGGSCVYNSSLGIHIAESIIHIIQYQRGISDHLSILQIHPFVSFPVQSKLCSHWWIGFLWVMLNEHSPRATRQWVTLVHAEVIDKNKMLVFCSPFAGGALGITFGTFRD